MGTVDALVHKGVQIISSVCIQTLNQWDSRVCKIYSSRLFLLGVRVRLQDKLHKRLLKPKPGLLWNVLWNLIQHILEEWAYIKKAKLQNQLSVNTVMIISPMICVTSVHFCLHCYSISVPKSWRNVRLLCLCMFLKSVVWATEDEKKLTTIRQLKATDLLATPIYLYLCPFK